MSIIAELILRSVGKVKKIFVFILLNHFHSCFSFSVSLDAEEPIPVAGTVEESKVSHASFMSVL